MAIKIKITELPPPELHFGSPGGNFYNPKLGLTQAGPFDLRFGSARKDKIRVGIIGELNELRNAKNWLERCKSKIDSGGNQKLSPNFNGFESIFRTELETNTIWSIEINKFGSVAAALSINDENERFNRMVELYGHALRTLSESHIKPDVVVCCISDTVLSKCFSISKKLSQQEKKEIARLQAKKENPQLSLFDPEIEETEEDLLNRDFRRALKAVAMKYRLPIQLATNRLLIDKVKGQDPATRAWNFSVGLYYKGGGIPWRLKNDGPETCFVGISFHHLQTTQKHLVFSSIAQAFSSKGDGFAIKGDSIPYDQGQGRRVNLTTEQAKNLGRQILEKYKEHTGNLPLRVVLHKTSKFNPDEEKGFYEAFNDIPIVELINLMPTSLRLLKIGSYPPKRGTLCELNDRHFLFTTGYITEMGTYPGPHIPTPMEIVSSKNIDIYRASEEILGLARMNWNTASISGGQPVTFFFARNVGGIIAEYGEDTNELPSSFKYYM